MYLYVKTTIIQYFVSKVSKLSYLNVLLYGKFGKKMVVKIIITQILPENN